ncbi:GNAT family N-acetyltransferase [Bacterioplanoides sp.]|uniref:GNAT family N-acetyltransferase n=1 Tax=Bacterioplanoides sp. TaxID=2066072 RepID=UPI003AFFCAF6
MKHNIRHKQQDDASQAELMYQFNINLSLADLNALYKHSGESGRAAPHDVRVGLYRHPRSEPHSQLEPYSRSEPRSRSGLFSEQEPHLELACGARLVRYDNDWLLRNLCTLPEERGQGLASRLLQELRTLPPYQPLLTLPLPHLEPFYLRNGFSAVDETGLSSSLQQLLRQCRRRNKGIRAMVSDASLR